MHKYEMVIFWSGEDSIYIAYAPELPGCMAHGDSYEDALNSVAEAMELWIDVANEFGDVVPKPRVNQITFDIHKAAPELSAINGS